MTYYDDPNRECVGLEPIWTGADGEALRAAPQEGFDPADHTVDEVKEYVDANPDQAAAVLAAEKAGKNRTTLVEPLEG